MSSKHGGGKPRTRKQCAAKQPRQVYRKKVVAESTAAGVAQALGGIDACHDRLRELESQISKDGTLNDQGGSGIGPGIGSHGPSVSLPPSLNGTDSSVSTEQSLGRAPPTYVSNNTDKRQVYDDSAKIYDAALLYFNQVGYSQKTLALVIGKIPLWMSQLKIEKTPGWAGRNLELVHELYYSRCSYYSKWRDYIASWKDWVIQHSLRISVWCGSAIVAGAAALFKFTGPKRVITLAALTIGPLALLYHIKTRPTGIISLRQERITNYCSNYQLRQAQDDIKETPNARIQMQGNYGKCVERTYPVGFSTAIDQIWIPRSCYHNELRAIAKRQLLPPLSTSEVRTELWNRAATDFSALFPLSSIADLAVIKDEDSMAEEFFCRYPLARRNVLKRAWDNYRLTGEVSSRSKSFVKVEWLTGKVLSKRDPRLISGKEEEYLAATGPWYWAWTKYCIKNFWCDVETALKQQFIYTGGMTADQIGLLISHFENDGWYAYEGDFSRYDGHNEVEALVAEMSLYQGKIPDYVLHYLCLQLSTDGGTGSGIRFSVAGKVASGVINTSFGNSMRGFMIDLMMMRACNLPDHEWKVLRLGDDNIIFTKRPVDTAVMIDVSYRMGHKLEVIQRNPDEYDYLEYCSQRAWNIGTQRVLGPKPFRVTAKSFMPHREIEEVDKYMQEIAVGYKNYWWIPWLGPICRKILVGAIEPVVGREASTNPYAIHLKLPLDVDEECVQLQFERIYGYVPSALKRIVEEAEPITPGTVWHHPIIYECGVIDGVVA